MTMYTPADHPHGMSRERFLDLFTADAPVVFAFHGYAGAVHHLLHGRPEPERFHVRGYREEGTTTTPFDMVVHNRTSRFHLAAEALQRTRRPPPDAEFAIAECHALLAKHAAYVREHFEDMPEICDWTWVDV